MTRRPAFSIVSGSLFVVMGIVTGVRIFASVGFVREALAGYALAAAMTALGIVRIASSAAVLRAARGGK